MIFNTLPREQEEPQGLEVIIEVDLVFECDEPVKEFPQYDVLQEDYLEKELERERQEELGQMLPIRIP